MSLVEAQRKLDESTKSLEIVRNIHSGALDSAEINRRLSRARSEYKTLESQRQLGGAIGIGLAILGLILIFTADVDSFSISGFLLLLASSGTLFFVASYQEKTGKLEIEIGALEKHLPTANQFESSRIERKEHATSLLQEGGLANLQEVLKIYSNLGHDVNDVKKEIAQEKEKLLDYAGAIKGFEELGLHDDAKRVRRKMLDEKKIDQTVVHGDYVDDRDTVIKDSVVSKSNVGASGKSKAEELREAKALLDEGLINEYDYEKMKKEILSK